MFFELLSKTCQPHTHSGLMKIMALFVYAMATHLYRLYPIYTKHTYIQNIKLSWAKFTHCSYILVDAVCVTNFYGITLIFSWKFIVISDVCVAKDIIQLFNYSKRIIYIVTCRLNENVSKFFFWPNFFFASVMRHVYLCAIC